MKRRIGYSCGHVIEDEIPEDEVQRLEILLGRKVDREPYAGFPVLDKPCGKCVFEERAKTHHHAAGTAGCEACIKALLHGPTSPPAEPTDNARMWIRRQEVPDPRPTCESCGGRIDDYTREPWPMLKVRYGPTVYVANDGTVAHVQCPPAPAPAEGEL